MCDSRRIPLISLVRPRDSLLCRSASCPPAPPVFFFALRPEHLAGKRKLLQLGAPYFKINHSAALFQLFSISPVHPVPGRRVVRVNLFYFWPWLALFSLHPPFSCASAAALCISCRTPSYHLSNYFWVVDLCNRIPSKKKTSRPSRLLI